MQYKNGESIKYVIKNIILTSLQYLKDKAVLYGISNKIWIFISSAVTAPIIIIYFTPTTQGFYYTFIGILGVQSLFELGLGQLLQQFFSHEWVKIKHIPGKGFDGDKDSILKLSSIKHFTIYWFSVLSVFLFFTLSIGGYFFMKRTTDIPISFWLTPWIVISLLKSIQIFLSPGLIFLEGINEVENVSKFRFLQSLQERIASWIVILIGGKLWVFSATSGINILALLTFFNMKYRSILKDLVRFKSVKNGIWKKDIFPLQWKYAISSLSGYLNFSFIVPLVFWFFGPITAGQMGISWAIITMFWNLSITLISTKIPTLAMYAASNDYKKFNKLMLNSSFVSTFLLVITTIFLLLGILIMELFYPKISSRFLPLTPFIFLSLSIIPHHLKYAMTSYMRSIKQEPFWKISILESILIIIILPLSCEYAGIVGLSISFFGIISLITGLTFLKFNKIKNELYNS